MPPPPASALAVRLAPPCRPCPRWRGTPSGTSSWPLWPGRPQEPQAPSSADRAVALARDLKIVLVVLTCLPTFPQIPTPGKIPFPLLKKSCRVQSCVASPTGLPKKNALLAAVTNFSTIRRRRRRPRCQRIRRERCEKSRGRRSSAGKGTTAANRKGRFQSRRRRSCRRRSL